MKMLGFLFAKLSVYEFALSLYHNSGFFFFCKKKHMGNSWGLIRVRESMFVGEFIRDHAW